MQVAQRSLLATLEITTAAALAHVLAGGHLPAAGFLFAFAGIVFACCLATIGRFLRIAVVVPFVLAAQIGLHSALDAAPAAHHGSVHAAAPEGVLGLTPAMFWAHLTTALVTAILLLLQERVVGAFVAYCRPVLTVPLDLGPRRRVRVGTPRFSLARAELLRVSPRRGPPRLVTATP